MPVITIDGQIGAGAPEVGRQVAQSLELGGRQRLALAADARDVVGPDAADQLGEHRDHQGDDDPDGDDDLDEREALVAVPVGSALSSWRHGR